MSCRTTKLMRSNPSGEVHAITFLEGKTTQVVVACSTALHYTDFEEALQGDFQSEPELVEWVSEMLENTGYYTLLTGDTLEFLLNQANKQANKNWN
jgi:hypothetical protein